MIGTALKLSEMSKVNVVVMYNYIVLALPFQH